MAGAKVNIISREFTDRAVDNELGGGPGNPIILYEFGGLRHQEWIIEEGYIRYNYNQEFVVGAINGAPGSPVILREEGDPFTKWVVEGQKIRLQSDEMYDEVYLTAPGYENYTQLIVEPDTGQANQEWDIKPDLESDELAVRIVNDTGNDETYTLDVHVVDVGPDRVRTTTSEGYGLVGVIPQGGPWVAHIVVDSDYNPAVINDQCFIFNEGGYITVEPGPTFPSHQMTIEKVEDTNGFLFTLLSE